MQQWNYQQIRWHCRRGMLELDLWLLPFFDKNFAVMPFSEQQKFVELLDSTDPELLDWLSGKNATEPAYLQSIVDAIRTCVQITM